jgi:hypothetical protein
MGRDPLADQPAPMTWEQASTIAASGADIAFRFGVFDYTVFTNKGATNFDRALEVALAVASLVPGGAVVKGVARPRRRLERSSPPACTVLPLR